MRNEIPYVATGYLSPKAEGGMVPHSTHHGVFAKQNIRRGEVIAVWGGEIIDGATLRSYDASMRRLVLQVEEDLYMVSSREGPSDWVNHSCEPNAGLRGQLTLVAMRPIASGEQVCFDYAMSDGSDYDEFPCACGSTRCRGKVTGGDWMLPELWLAYGKHFSPYLRRRIERFKRRLRRDSKRAPSQRLPTQTLIEQPRLARIA